MHSPCIREASEACFHGCCPNPLLDLPESHTAATTRSPGSAAASRYDFAVATASSLHPNTYFTNHESLPSLEESFAWFIKVYPQYPQTDKADEIRAQEYYHLLLSKHVCLDYLGHGLFSYSQLQNHHYPTTNYYSMASSSSSPPPFLSLTTEPPFFDISYKPVKLNSQMLYGGEESEFESKIRKRLMDFMNISDGDYTVVFTANQSSAFKLLADCYPFQSNRDLLTVYDYENEPVELMIENSKKRGARIMSAEFSWPNLGIQSGKLKKKVASKSKSKNRKRGLFVFPLQSRVTGSRYSYLWMSMAQENGWHVLLDACALGPKDMDTLGLSLFKPDFLICSFFKVFGENPSGFCCLFVKKSSASVLNSDSDSAAATGVGIVSLVPPSVFSSSRFCQDHDQFNIETQQKSELNTESDEGTDSKQLKLRSSPISEIEELKVEPARSRIIESSVGGRSKVECRSLDHADLLGLIVISSRARCLINWLVNALMSLRHPHSETGDPAVKIYGPKIMFDRGPALAFNVFDWNGEKIDPLLVQKLADRSNISLSIGFLQNIWFSDKHEGVREKVLDLERRTSQVDATRVLGRRREKFGSISVVTAALGFLTNFEDIYRLWVFVSRFLDADFLEKERWRYKALNQKTIEF